MSSSRARKLRLAVPVFLSSIFLLLTSCFLVAQDSATGSLRGVVLDPSGSRVAQASIALVNNANGIRYISQLTHKANSPSNCSREITPPASKRRACRRRLRHSSTLMWVAWRSSNFI